MNVSLETSAALRALAANGDAHTHLASIAEQSLELYIERASNATKLPNHEETNEAAFQDDLTKKDQKFYNSFSSLNANQVKTISSAILSTFLEASKVNASEKQLTSFLNENQFEASLCEKLTSLHNKYNAALRALLQRTRIAPSTLVDCDWQLDYYIKSSTLEKVSEPMYRVTLIPRNDTTPNPPSIKVAPLQSSSTSFTNDTHNNVTFVATRLQLQELVLKLKDAVKQIDRSALELQS